MQMESILSKSLSTEEVISILQLIFPYDLTPMILSSFHVKSRGREVTLQFLFDFLELVTRGESERYSVFGRLVGELAGRRIGDFDSLTLLAQHVVGHS
jgi:hypothetical protein